MWLGVVLGLLLWVFIRLVRAKLLANMREFNAERDRIERECAAEAERERIEQVRFAEAERERRQQEALQAVF